MRLFHIVSKLAWRNLWRNHRRTMVMISAITVGVWAMIFMTALLRGMVNQMVVDGIKALPGHVQIHNPEFLDDPGINNLVVETDEEILARFAGSGIDRWAARVKVPAVITSERDTRGVTLFGVDPVMESGISFYGDDIVEGRNLNGPDDPGIVIGRALAEILETETGKRVVLMSQDPTNDVADRGFRIIGLFESKLETYEKTMIFAGKSTIQKMLKIPGRVNEIVVVGDDYRNVQPLIDKVRSVVSDDEYVQGWKDVDKYLGTTMSMMDGFVLIWMIVVFVALSFGLVNTLVMAVFERVREIGLMLALGMRPISILLQVVVESILLLVIGLAIGNLLAWLTIIPLQDGIDISVVGDGLEMYGAASVLYPQLLLKDVLLANAVVLSLGFLASLSPAWRASRYEPIEAITKV